MFPSEGVYWRSPCWLAVTLGGSTASSWILSLFNPCVRSINQQSTLRVSLSSGWNSHRQQE